METMNRNSMNNQADRRKRKNVPCSLLSNSENEKLFEIIGTNCMSMACAVVQLFLTDMKSNHLQWLKKCCGVMCLIKDFSRRSYFLRSYDIDKCVAVWEQELYEQFEYKAPKCFFHTFEADNCMAGINFADTEEAKKFKEVVCKTVKDRRERRQEKRRSQQALRPTNTGVIVLQRDLTPAPSLKDSKEKEGRKWGHKRGKLTKEDIGLPTNFTVIQHVGFDPERGFEVTADDPELLSFLSMAGVSQKDLRNENTRKFIYDFIDQHGGIDVAKQEVMMNNLLAPTSAPQPPVREAPPTPGTNRNLSTRAAAPPPPPPPPPSVPPVGSHQLPAYNVSRTTGSAPPPPPPPSRTPVAPRSPAHGPSPGRGGGHVMMSGTAPPPPPPPPPAPPAMNSCGPPPPPPPPAPNANFNQGQPDTRSAMMEQIRKGKSLNPVEINENNTTPVVDDARDALLSQIRRGIELKRVSSDDQRNSTPARPMIGLAGALARALQERNRAINNSDESESGDDDEDNDDDEWED